MASDTTSHADYEHYYVPESSVLPIWTALALITMLSGLGFWLNSLGDSGGGNPLVFTVGFLFLITVLYFWFGVVIKENHQGLPSAQLKRSYVWGMGWFIFSEVMFFAAFFGALFYARGISLPWLGGEGGKAETGIYLWSSFAEAYQASGWPMLENPDSTKFVPPHQSMGMPQDAAGWAGYLPLWNTLILITSSFTVHFAHGAILADQRKKAINWMIVTVALGFTFVALQALEYYEAYAHMGLTLDSGIYGSTFFLLTGFHGFHVTLGAVILTVAMIRMMKGHFSATDQFGLEAGSWYWHFVDVVWVCLFFLVYLF